MDWSNEIAKMNERWKVEKKFFEKFFEKTFIWYFWGFCDF